MTASECWMMKIIPEHIWSLVIIELNFIHLNSLEKS